MLEPLEPVVALGFGKGNDRERLQVELPTIEHHEAPTYFKIARLGRLFQFRFSKRKLESGLLDFWTTYDALLTILVQTFAEENILFPFSR